MRITLAEAIRVKVWTNRPFGQLPSLVTGVCHICRHHDDRFDHSEPQLA